MKRTAILASVLVLSLAACKKKEGDKPAEPGKPAEPAQPAAPPEPFTGKLTIDRLLGAKGLADPLTPFADGLAKLKGQLGEPTRVKDGEYQWAVLEGDDCAYTYITKEDGAKFQRTGDVVGTAMTPMKVGKDGPSGNLAECKEILGITAGPPEDPSAAGPPTDGSAVGVEAFRAGVIPARSKWKGQPVKVAGLFGGMTTSTAGTDTWITVNLKASADDAGKPVTCSLPKNSPAPTFASNDKVEAAGTVKIQEWTSMGNGTVTLEAALDECALTKTK